MWHNLHYIVSCLVHIEGFGILNFVKILMTTLPFYLKELTKQLPGIL